MGLEAVCRCSLDGRSFDVKALLESREFILRGEALRKSFAISDMAYVRAEGANLCFKVAGEEIELDLGVDRAGRWAKKITTPPPSLANKLGIGPSVKVLVIGPIADNSLKAALEGAATDSTTDAHLSLAVVFDEIGLKQALTVHEALPTAAPMWIVYGKGPRAGFGESAVREAMRNAGYMDNKVSAVSDALSAARFARCR